MPISINISRVDFASDDPVSIITSCVESHGIASDLISIEITETAAMSDPVVVAEAVRRFREAGHEVLMDDFGSAYSSLNALRMFEFNEIKLDMAFMKDFDEKTREVVAAIVTMAKELGAHPGLLLWQAPARPSSCPLDGAVAYPARASSRA